MIHEDILTPVDRHIRHDAYYKKSNYHRLCLLKPLDKIPLGDRVKSINITYEKEDGQVSLERELTLLGFYTWDDEWSHLVISKKAWDEEMKMFICNFILSYCLYSFKADGHLLARVSIQMLNSNPKVK